MQSDHSYTSHGDYAPCVFTVRDSPDESPPVEGAMTFLPTRQKSYTLRLPLNPVYVEDVDGTEVLRYREADMVMGKLYRFEWYGEWYAVLRSEKGVELLKFYPDGK